MNHLPSNPVVDVIFAVALIIIGVLMFVYRNEIGALTGYYTGRGGRVDKPTPGWMLIPFALALIAIGVVVMVRSC